MDLLNTLVLLAALVTARPAGREQTAIFAGGCYWGIESVFEHVRGVQSAVSGLAWADTARSRAEFGVAPQAGYVEAVRVVFDSTQVSYRQLLEVFFRVAHDPTQVNRQGPDVGPSYRSALFLAGESQSRTARSYLAELRTGAVYPAPITTELAVLRQFREVEADQQDYAERHPTELYILVNDRPKVEALRRQFPSLYRAPTP